MGEHGIARAIILLLSQGFQVPALDVIHEDVHALELVLFEHAVHPWQGSVVKPLEDRAFKDKSLL
jgi:hypothetical protein